LAEAALWGFVAGSSLLLGALIALRLRPGRRVVGLLMAFGAGVLISAVAYDLVDESKSPTGAGRWVPASPPARWRSISATR
jgi:zinc transporter, ZIP family